MRTTSYTKHETNHLLHLLLSFATCGLWLPVWFAVWAFNASVQRKAVTVVTEPTYPRPQMYAQPIAAPRAYPATPARLTPYRSGLWCHCGQVFRSTLELENHQHVAHLPQ
jgi:hypothetical protein